MEKFKDMEKAMEERVRQLETRVENIDKRHDSSHPASQRSDPQAIEPDIKVPALSVHVKALEICSEEILEHMLPHIDAILTEMERRVPAIYLSPLTPPATGEVAQGPTSNAEAAETATIKRNKPPKRNRRPLSGNFTAMSVADTPLSPTNGQSPPVLTTPLSPTSVSQSPPKATSNGNVNPPLPTAGQNPIPSSSVASVTTSVATFFLNNPVFTTLPRSSTASAGSQSLSQHTVTTTAKATNGAVTSKVSFDANSTQTVYSTNASIPTAVSTSNGNPSSHGNTNPFLPSRAESFEQPKQGPSSQAPARTATPSIQVPTPTSTKPTQVAPQVIPVNIPRFPAAPTPPRTPTSASNTITQLSSIANLITSPTVKTTSTGAIPRHAAAPVYSGWLEPLQPQLTETALTAQRLANVMNSISATSNGSGYPQAPTLSTSNLNMPTTERQTVPSSSEAAAGAATITTTLPSANSLSVSSTNHSGNQASSFMNPSPVAQQPVLPPAFNILHSSAQQPAPTSSLSRPLAGAQHPPTSSNLNLQPQTSQLPGPTALPIQQTPIMETQINPSVAAPTFTTTTRSILKDESSASRPHATAQDPFAQPKQVRFDVPPSPTMEHPLTGSHDGPQTTPTSSPVELESRESQAFTGPLSFAEATDLLKSSAISGHVEDVRRALDAGASIDAADAHGQRALHWAAWCDHAQIVEVLVRRGADLELRNDLGLTPLHMAARGGSAQCVAFLLDAGVRVDARANNRRTALHLAASKGCDAVVQVLLASGADKSLLDVEGKSAFDLALTDEIRELLIY